MNFYNLQDLEWKMTLSLLLVTCLFVWCSRLLLLSPSAQRFRCLRFSHDSLAAALGTKGHDRESTSSTLAKCWLRVIRRRLGEGELMQAFKGGTGHHARLLLVKAVEGGKMDVNEKIVAADTRLPMSWDEQRRPVSRPSWIRAAKSSSRRKPTGLVRDMCHMRYWSVHHFLQKLQQSCNVWITESLYFPGKVHIWPIHTLFQKYFGFYTHRMILIYI